MNSARPTLFARMWSTFKGLPVAGKVAVIALSLLVIFAAGQDPKPAPRPPIVHDSVGVRPYRNNMRPASAPYSGSQALAQLQEQHSKLTAWAQQCMAQMNETARTNAMRAMQGYMPVQAPCTQTMYQVNAQMAVVEAQISRLQGGTGNVCSLTGYCAPSSTPGATSSGFGTYNPGDDGTGAVERTSREGTLGQCIYRSNDGYETTQSCNGGDHYWQNIETGQFIARQDQPNDRYDYRLFNYKAR